MFCNQCSKSIKRDTSAILLNITALLVRYALKVYKRPDINNLSASIEAAQFSRKPYIYALRTYFLISEIFKLDSLAASSSLNGHC